MKRITVFLTMTFLICIDSFGQKLSLTDLTSLCNKKNWEDVNQTLLAKNWTYFDSEKASSNKYNTITWSFNKDYFSDEAQGWLYLYTYEDFPNKISYSVFNKEAYSYIQNSILTNGFKLLNSEIKNSEVISTYGNSSFTLSISTERRTDNDWNKSSLTAYNIVLIKKAGIYDVDNGKKTEYYYDGLVRTEYTLLNGEINGGLKEYHHNGKLKLVGNYSKGNGNGLFKEYDESGNLATEFTMSNGIINGVFKKYDDFGNLKAEFNMSGGLKNGLYKEYENGKISYSKTFKDDIENGQYVGYSYNYETRELVTKGIGEFFHGEKQGNWKVFVFENGKERLLILKNYSNGILNGSFQDVQGDSLVIGTYKNGKLHGDFKIYTDYLSFVNGNFIRTDTSNLTLQTTGYYYEDIKSDYWKYYDITGTLRSEGNYLNGEKNGEWKYYYTNWGNEKPYSKKLFLIENNYKGKLNGKSTRYSYLDKEEYPCSENKDDISYPDTCIRYSYIKVFETSYYKENKLYGSFELRDSLNDIIDKGNFKNDYKDGEWLQRYSENDVNGETYYIYQKGNYLNDQREGKWIQYSKKDEISVTWNYQNGLLHGEYIAWNSFSKQREIKQFNKGKLAELITYDSLGLKPLNKFVIYDEKFNSYKCRWTFYIEDGYISQEFWVKKENEIDHNLFEIKFALSIAGYSDGTEGYKDGEYKRSNSNNQPIVTGKFYKEDRYGLWTFYYYEQNVIIESNYTQNKPTDEKYHKLNGDSYSGEFVYFDYEKGIKEVRKIKDGLRNGKTIFKDLKTDKTIKKENYKNGELK